MNVSTKFDKTLSVYLLRSCCYGKTMKTIKCANQNKHIITHNYHPLKCTPIENCLLCLKLNPPLTTVVLYIIIWRNLYSVKESTHETIRNHITVIYYNILVAVRPRPAEIMMFLSIENTPFNNDF